MAKSFQDRIKDLQDYRPDITYKDGAFILKIRFKKNWQIIQPKNDNEVAYSKDDKIDDLHWYVSTIEDSDKVFDLIDETIALQLSRISRGYQAELEQGRILDSTEAAIQNYVNMILRGQLK